jgi:hypothetical protein
MRASIFAVLAAVIATAAAPGLGATDAPLELKWAQLVPPQAAPQPRRLKTFLPPTADAAPDGGSADGGPPPPPLPEGKWMSMKRRTVGSPAAVVKELNGKRVHIGGYVVPLDFEATKIKEFLLVPFVGACIHVPPPPANQIIYVKAAEAFDTTGNFDPVYVTGKLQTEAASTGLADTGYTLDAETVEVRKE